MRWLAVALLGCACVVPSDLGSTCTLMRPVDGGLEPISEGELQARLRGHPVDVLTFGAVECEELVCVREADFPAGAELTAPARGHCSRPCSSDAMCASSSTAMICRALLLDEATLHTVCTEDAGVFCAPVGGAREPLFCGAAPLNATAP